MNEVPKTHLRGLPDGSLTKTEVNILIDYIEKLERLINRHDADREEGRCDGLLNT